MRIVIAEDEQRARIGISNMIHQLGDQYEIVGMARNGRDALEMIRSTNPDVVFTDIKMPYMSGLELIKASRDQKIATHFILVSAYAEFEFAKEALKLGVEDYILKPISKEELSKVLQNMDDKIRFGTKQEEDTSSLREKYPNVHPLIGMVLDTIESGYSGNLNQQQIAKQLQVSPEYLSYLFGKEIGDTFARFVKEYRIQKATELLRTKQSTPKEVPYEVGFTDGKYFNRVFKEVVGESVSNYVRKL